MKTVMIIIIPKVLITIIFLQYLNYRTALDCHCFYKLLTVLKSTSEYGLNSYLVYGEFTVDTIT